MNKDNVRIVDCKLNVQDVYRMVEYPTKKWIKYGEHNDFPNYLKELYASSPTHSSLVNGISYIIASEGIKLESPSDPQTNAFVNLQFDYNLIKNLSFDLKCYGYAVIKCYGREKIRKIEYTPAIKWRSGSKNSDNVVETWWHSENWNSSFRNKPKEYPLLNFNETEDVSVCVFQQPKLGNDYYPFVDYIAGLNSGFIPLEYHIGNFHYSNIQNGMAPSTLIQYNNGVPTTEIMDKVENDIKKKWTGSENAGRIIIAWNESKEQAATIETITTTDLPEQFQFLSKESMEKILISHRSYLVSQIFGLQTNNGFSNNSEELKNQYKLWYKIVIEPFQTILIDGFKDVLLNNMLFGELYFDKFDPWKVEETKLSKVTEEPNINDFDALKIKNDDTILINVETLTGVVKSDKFYRFVRSSNKKNLFLTKMDINSKNNFIFKPSPLIKNTNDYYWEELSVIKKIKE